MNRCIKNKQTFQRAVYFYVELIRYFTKPVITRYRLFGSTNYDCEFYLQIRVRFIGSLAFSLFIVVSGFITRVSSLGANKRLLKIFSIMQDPRPDPN